MKRTIVNPVLRDSVTFIRTAAETNGKVSELEITLQPGGGNPMHYHTSYTETFTALKGELGIEKQAEGDLKTRTILCGKTQSSTSFL